MTDAREDDAARLLDLAAFADGLLDEEERDRVTALLEADPDAAADVRAARTRGGIDQTSADLEHIVARACAMVPDTAAGGRVFVIIPRETRRRIVQGFAQWGSLAAALLLASWLGFAMGTDASVALSEPRQPSDTGFLPEVFDPASGFLRDLAEGLRT